MKKAGEYFDDACNKHQADQKKLKKDLYDEDYFVEAIKQAQMDAIDECIKSLKIDYPDGYEKTLNNILKLKEEL